MIDQNKFYSEKDILDPGSKQRIWQTVNSQISNKDKFIEWKSFAMGIAATILIILSSFGAVSVVNLISKANKPEIVVVNDVYQQLTSNLEKIIPAKFENHSGSIKVDDYLISRHEKLSDINSAIAELRNDIDSKDYSSLKNKRLRDLYLIKLNIIEELIRLEEI